jgi:outer membrane protein
MKNGLLVLNIVLFLAVAVLYYLHFSNGSKPASVKAEQPATGKQDEFRIAYFEMDSLESSFSMVKDVKTELSRKENAINNELEKMERTFQNKMEQYRAQGETMTQVQSEMAQRDVMQMQQSMQSRKQQLEAELQDLVIRKQKDVKSRIEDFLRDYNASRRYTYIVAYEPGLFYYRDSTLNITSDLIEGLNQAYKKK